MDASATVTGANRRAIIPLAVGAAKTNIPYLALGMITAYLRQSQSDDLLPQ